MQIPKILQNSAISLIVKSYHFFVNILYYNIKLGKCGYKSCIVSPLSIDGGKRIFLGNVNVGYKTWLAANPLTDAKECALIIKDGCNIGHFNHIYATGKIIFEQNVLTADRVYVSDNLHGYEDIDVPIKCQPIKQNGQVTIGEGSWLGENVCVLGASIGKHCVIGANSVVTHNIPDYSVAVGIPAIIIKRFNFKTKQWDKTDKQGNFIY